MAVGSAAAPWELELIRQLRVVAVLGHSRRASPQAAAPHVWQRLWLGVYNVVIALAAAEVTIAAIVAAQAVSTTTTPAVNWPFFLNMLLFGTCGLALISGGGRDVRIRLLGALFVVIASAFAHPLLPRSAIGAFGVLTSELRRMPADAFLALALWRFAWVFPTEPKQHLMLRAGTAALALSAVIGAALFGANVTSLDDSWPGSQMLQSVSWAFNRDAPLLGYWPLLFGIAAPAIPYLLWKSRLGTMEERRRAAFFVVALAVAVTPMLAVVVASPFLPTLNDPARRWWVGVVLYAALASLVPATAYAVMVRRVMDVHFVVRKTLQHALARYAVWCASIGPPTYLIASLYLDRDQPVSDAMARGGVELLAVSIGGFLTLTFRHQLLAIVDRWFLREPIDYGEALARLGDVRTSRSIRELGAALTNEIERAIHPSTVVVLVVNEAGTELVPLDARDRPLSAASALYELLGAMGTEIQLDVGHDGPLARLLPPAERVWLVETKIQLLVPLNSSTGTLVGVIGVGESRTGLQYSKSDRALLAAMSGYAATLLENHWLRQQPCGNQSAGSSPKGLVRWSDEPATYCGACSLVSAPKATTCACGAETTIAPVPLVLNGKFRVERLLGSGGMGVVYLAVDLALNRKVAIKTMPSMSRQRAMRLEREARAMASVLHPNLALIYGAERWREVPMLIVEYLEGGTLLDRLRHGPLVVSEVIDLGIVLADALDSVHLSGILHRDIKPSNIGYAADGEPRLLDFGLASILDQFEDGAQMPSASPIDPAAAAAVLDSWTPATAGTSAHQLVGTPLYLSPEAFANAPPQASFDLWALSLVLYEALCGRHPLGGRSVAEISSAIHRVPMAEIPDLRPECPASVAAFFVDALSLVPARRPATAGALRTELQRLRARLGSV